MSEEKPSLSLEERLRAAYAPGEGAACPPPEAFLEEAEGLLDEPARQRLLAHAEGCPACAAERELARLYAAGAEGAGVAAEDLEFVTGRLRSASPVEAAPAAPAVPANGGKVVPFPSRRREEARRTPSWARWAAAAVFVLAAGLAFRLAFPPAGTLPPPDDAGVVRGARIEGLAPQGEVMEVPGALSWEPVPGAASYELKLVAVDGTVLWETTLAAPPARLPAEVRGRLLAAVRYSYSVRARDARGGEIAVSEEVSFRAAPRSADS